VLQQRIQGGERVLDCGSGSGILGVTAARLGAREVLGFDVDPAAADYGMALASDNGLAQRCRFVRGGFETLANEPRAAWDVVLANIYSDVIQSYASELASALRPTGWFAFSGCPVHHLDTTTAAIEGSGLVLEDILTRGRWTTFVGRPS